jgi:hypothetical protein
MFKWLFRRNAAAANETEDSAADFERFESAYQMLSARAAALKKEYDRTHADPTINIDVTKNLETYKDPAYLVGCRNAIFATVEDPRYRGAHQILPLVATIFMTMASEPLSSNSSIPRFSIWANAFSGVQKRELVRFAYIATVWSKNNLAQLTPCHSPLGYYS